MTVAATSPGRHRANGGATAQPSGANRRSRVDAATVLTVYFLFTMILPAGLKIATLGSLGAPSSIVAVLVLVWWIWDHFHRYAPGQQRVQLVRRTTVAMIIATLIIHRHAMMQPLVTDEISPSDSALVRFLALLGIILVASDGITDTERFQVFARRITVMAGLLGALALIQLLTGELWVDRISVPGLTPLLADGGISRGRFLRPSGTSTHPIEFGAVLSMLFPLVVYRARLTQEGKRMAWVSATTVGLAILLSLSRTALICTMLAMLIMLPTWPRKTRWRAVIIAFVTLLAASIVVPGLLGTLRGLFMGGADDPSVASRTAGYAYAEQMFGHNPWLGRGLGTFLPKYYIYDNGYLGMLMEAGLIGVALFFVVVIAAMISAFSAARMFVRVEDRQLSWALLASVVAGSFSLAFFDLFSFPQSAACLALVLGMSGAAYRLAREPSGVETAALSTGTNGDHQVAQVSLRGIFARAKGTLHR